MSITGNVFFSFSPLQADVRQFMQCFVTPYANAWHQKRTLKATSTVLPVSKSSHVAALGLSPRVTRELEKFQVGNST